MADEALLDFEHSILIEEDFDALVDILLEVLPHPTNILDDLVVCYLGSDLN